MDPIVEEYKKRVKFEAAALREKEMLEEFYSASRQVRRRELRRRMKVLRARHLRFTLQQRRSARKGS